VKRRSESKNLFNVVIKQPEFAVVFTLVILIVIFSSFSNKFLTLSSITSMFTISAELGLIAIGTSFLMISGEFDLSVGSVFGFATFLLTYLANSGVPPVIAFLITLASSICMGFLNGIITIRLKIPSFIATLGTMMFWRGALLFLTGGTPVVYNADRTFIEFLGGKIYLMLRAPAIWFILVTIVFSVILTRTRYGNWVFATGGNLESANAAGVPTDRVKIINFVICSTLAAMSGMMNVARFSLAQATLGTGKELEAIAAAVVGGNMLTGGFGSIIGTFLGAITLGIIRTGLIMVGVPPFLYLAITGIVIILAVVTNKTLRK